MRNGRRLRRHFSFIKINICSVIKGEVYEGTAAQKSNGDIVCGRVQGKEQYINLREMLKGL